MQWCRDSRKVSDKLGVEIAEPKECLELLDTLGFWPFCYGIYLLWVHANCVLLYDMAQVLQLI